MARCQTGILVAQYHQTMMDLSLKQYSGAGTKTLSFEAATLP